MAHVAWVGDVRCADEVRKPCEVGTEDIATVVVAVMEIYRLGTALLLNILKPVRDGAECLIPGNPLPLAFSPLTNSLHRVLQPIGRVENLFHVLAPHGELALALGVCGIAIDGSHLPSLDAYPHLALRVRIHITHRGDHLFRSSLRSMDRIY